MRLDKWKRADRDRDFAGDSEHETLQRLHLATESNVQAANQILDRYRASFGRDYGTLAAFDMLPTIEPQQEGSMSPLSQKIRVIGFSKTLRWTVWDSRKMRYLSETLWLPARAGLATLLIDLTDFFER